MNKANDKILDGLVRERDELARRVADLEAERDALAAERDALAAERDRLVDHLVLPVPVLGGAPLYRLSGEPTGLCYPHRAVAVAAVRRRAGLDREGEG